MDKKLKTVDAFYSAANKYSLDREKFRDDFFHGGFYDKKKLAEYTTLADLFDFCLACAEKEVLKYKILIIDNNLRDEENKEIREILDNLKFIARHFPDMEFYLCDTNFQSIKYGEKKIQVSKLQNQNGKWGGNEQRDINKFNLILLDLFLGDGFRGEDILPVYLKNFPHIPVFIFSGSRDFDVVRNTLQQGADYFIPKEETIALPYRILKYQKDIGQLVNLIKKDNLRKNLIGNIRKWQQEKNYLWHGDKVYHMVDHSFNHTKNVWSIANQLLFPLLRNKRVLADEDLYALAMGIWLHDIGHKGNCFYGQVPEIREHHGIISAYFILEYPNLFGIYGRSSNEHKKYILEGKGKFNPPKLRLAEKIALLCKYHKSNSPMTVKDYKDFIKKEWKEKKNIIPKDFYKHKYKHDGNGENNIILLEKFVSSSKEEKNLLLLCALLKFIDGLDTNENKVGSDDYKLLKEKVIEEDIKYYKKENRNYAGFLKKQRHHYELNRSVTEAKIEFVENNCNINSFNIVYVANPNVGKDCAEIKKYFTENKVDGESLHERIVSNAQREWEDGKEWLSDFFEKFSVEPGSIKIVDKSGKELFNSEPIDKVNTKSCLPFSH